MNTNLNTEVTLHNRIVWITGAGRGIGRALAHTFGIDGARVVLSARDTDEISKLADDIKNSGGQAIAIPCDVTRKEDIDSLINTITKNWGDIDILINNAGIFKFGETVDFDEAYITGTVNLHILTLSMLCNLFGKVMKENSHGYILNMSSIIAYRTFPFISLYVSGRLLLL